MDRPTLRVDYGETAAGRQRDTHIRKLHAHYSRSKNCRLPACISPTSRALRWQERAPPTVRVLEHPRSAYAQPMRDLFRAKKLFVGHSAITLGRSPHRDRSTFGMANRHGSVVADRNSLHRKTEVLIVADHVWFIPLPLRHFRSCEKWPCETAPENGGRALLGVRARRVIPGLPRASSRRASRTVRRA